MSAEILVCFALDRMDHVLSTSIVKGIQHRSVRRSGAGHGARSGPVSQPPPLAYH